MTSAQVDSIYQRSSRAVHQTRDTPSSLLRAAAAGKSAAAQPSSMPKSIGQAAATAPWNKRTSVMSHHTGAPGLPSSSGIASTSDALGTVSSGALRHAHQHSALAGVSLPAAPRQPTADEPRRSAARNAAVNSNASPFRAPSQPSSYQQQQAAAPPAVSASAGDPLREAPRYVILYNRASPSSVSTVNDVLARTQHPHPILFDWSVRAVDVGDAEHGQTADGDDQVVVQRLQRMREFAPALRDGVVLYDRVQRCAYQDVNTIAHHIVAQRDVLVGALVAHEMVRRRTGVENGGGTGNSQPSATARQPLYNVDADTEYGAGAAVAATGGGGSNRTVAEVCQRQVLPCDVKDLDRYGAEAASRIRFGGGNAGGGGGDGGEYDQMPPSSRARNRHGNGSGDIGSIQVSRGGAGAGAGGGGGGGSASGART